MKFVTMTSVSVMAVMGAAAQAQAQKLRHGLLTGFERMEYVPGAERLHIRLTAAAPLLADSIGQQRQLSTFTPTGAVAKSFQGISQYDVASYGRNFVPPDTMGAVGTTQFTQFANGGFAVFGKDGTVEKAISDVAFWAAAGQTGANGDSRVQFDAAAQPVGRALLRRERLGHPDRGVEHRRRHRRVAVHQVHRLVGPGGAANSVADYPTLAIDHNAVYIGTNNFGATDAAVAGVFPRHDDERHSAVEPHQRRRADDGRASSRSTTRMIRLPAACRPPTSVTRCRA